MIFRDINFYKKLDLLRIIFHAIEDFKKIRYVVIIDKFIVTYAAFIKVLFSEISDNNIYMAVNGE